MREVKVIGIDIAKNVFQLHGVNELGKVVLEKRISRSRLSEFVATLPKCLIGMEACSGSNYWALKFQAMGHDVKLISPQYVKPYVKTNKNDQRDAEAICEAVTRPHMRFVALKSKDQKAIQCIHRMRSRLVNNRTALSNQIRSILTEYGVVMPQGTSQIKNQLVAIIEYHEEDLTPIVINLLRELHEEYMSLDLKIKKMDKKIELLCKQSELCSRLLKIEGVGPLSASALVAAIGNPYEFKNGRQLSAWLGLVPKQKSSGNKCVLLGISKRGDKYLRKLLIHGARAVITRKREISEELKSLILRRGYQKAYVAVANRNARIIWSMMANKTEYQPNYKKAA